MWWERLSASGDRRRGAARRVRHDARRDGAVALITVLVLMAVALALATSLNLLSVSEITTVGFRTRSLGTLAGSDACVEEALVQLSRNAAYTGGTLTLGRVSCTATVTDRGSGIRDILVTSSDSPLARHVRSQTALGTITLSGRTIGTTTLTSWQEGT